MTDGPSRPRVLIVDDDAAVLRFLTMAAERLGWEATGLSDGAKAFDTARTLKPDLVLLDLMMPGHDGYSILAHLRQDESLRDMPVCLLSGEPAAVHDAIGRELGATAYLEKPVGIKELRAFLDRISVKSA
jgi:DNA-binding response OmpR family regulator